MFGCQSHTVRFVWLFFVVPFSFAQLVIAESRILFQLIFEVLFSLVITYSGNHITELTIDIFFTVVTNFLNLKKLSLVSLGLWGSLLANISLNFILGEISLKSLFLAKNLFNESVPDLKGLKTLEVLDLSGNNLGSKFSSLSNNNNNLVSLNLSNNFLKSEIPKGLK